MENNNFMFAALQSMKDTLDNIMKPVRTIHERDQSVGRNWYFLPFGRALFNFNFKSKDDSTNLGTLIASSAIPTYLLGVAGFMGIPELMKFLSTSNNLFYLLLGSGYLFSVVQNFKRLVSIEDQYFNIHAYKKLRPQEFKLFMSYIEAQPFTFNALYDHVKELMQQSTYKVQEHFDILRQKEKEYDRLLESIHEISKNYQSLIRDYDIQNNLFKLSMNSFLRSANRKFNKDDLRLISDFSLHRLDGNSLREISEHRTSNTPSVINVKSKKHRDWAIVKAALEDSDTIYYDNSHGRVVAAKKFVMPKSEIWVYCFHFEETDNHTRDIIKTKELSRLLYTILCSYQNLEAKEGKGRLLKNEKK